MNEVDKTKILAFMEKRMNALRHLIEKDFAGNLAGTNEAFREVKYWKEAIERGEFELEKKEKFILELDEAPGLVFVQEEPGSRFTLFQDGKKVHGIRSVKIYADFESVTTHEIEFVTGATK